MRAAWIEVDLDAYRGNLRAVQALAPGAGLIAVVKANAYGHGLVPIARAAVEAGAAALGVSIPEEGIALRDAGITERILVLSVTLPEHASEIVAAGLEPVISTAWGVEALAAAAARQERSTALHLKVDTGMTRVGCVPEEANALYEAIRTAPSLRLVGLMTHYASADTDPGRTRAQLARFHDAVDAMRPAVAGWLARHTANSAAILRHPETHLELVRPGLVSYGVPPPPEPLPPGMRPVMSMMGRLTQVRWVPRGSAVGYGGTFVTTRRSLLGVVPVGYADGLPWRASGRLRALARGVAVPVVGRISMDQVVLDLTELGGAQPGETVVFIGEDGARRITVQQLAEAAGSMPYEILTGMAARLPRVYRDGEGYNGGDATHTPGETPS